MTNLNINRVTERIIVAGSGFLLIGAIAAIDEDVRGRLVNFATSGGSTELSVAGASLRRLVSHVTEAVGSHGAEHSLLVVFAIAALILLMLMPRT